MLRRALFGILSITVACTESSTRNFASEPSSEAGVIGGGDSGADKPAESASLAQAQSDAGARRGDGGMLNVPLTPPGVDTDGLPAACTSDARCDDDNPCNGVERCVEQTCVEADALADGEICATDEDEHLVCRGGNCLTSRCGDGIVDARRSEACDDGNSERGDGCDDCSFSCVSAEECNDSNICNGDELCDTELHVCVAGNAAADATECGDGYVCRDARCVSARCGDSNVDADEECDDGNLTAGDGCDSSCAYECSTDEACNDGDVCNGEEVCDIETHMCLAGSVLSCDDGNPCTTDACDPQAGCSPVLIDGDHDGQAPSSLGDCGKDCDDADETVYAGAGELCDGIDNNCDDQTDESAPVWYPDCDGDGYAAKDAEGLQQCETPATAPVGCGRGSVGGWTARPPAEGVDCWDADPAVYPRTDAVWNAAPIPGREELPFDYNCNDVEDVRWTNVGVSSKADCNAGIVVAPIDQVAPATPLVLPALVVRPILCSGSAGWTGRTVPACGAPASYTYCDGCSRVTEEREQQCQ